MASEIIVLSGYGAPSFGSKRSKGENKMARRHRRGGGSGQKARFARAAKYCKGRGKGFRSCMRSQLKK